MMFGHGMFVVPLLVLLGFAYLIWVVASKESANTKFLGQFISGLLVLAVIGLLVTGGMHKRHFMRGEENFEGMKMQCENGMMKGGDSKVVKCDMKDMKTIPADTKESIPKGPDKK